MTTEGTPETLGYNAWLLDEMYRQYQEAPDSVSETWREFFADYRPAATPPTPSPAAGGNGASVEAPAPAGQAAVPHPAPAPAPPLPPGLVGDESSPMRGAAAAIVRNMQASLAVPTATSVRTVPAKVLEENRRILNRHLQSSRGRKVSFTHLIAWAVVKAVERVPAMNASYTEVDAKPTLVRHESLNLGLAVDLEKNDGTRTLLVPNVKNAQDMDFAAFHAAYEDAVRKARTGKLGPDDMSGTTATITNPGTIGTEHSVPRLMPGQGVIVGVGSITFPVGLAAADPQVLASLGVAKVVTLTSTYDHRIIQGAESGEFLRWIERLLVGDEDFYEKIFTSLGLRHEPFRSERDRNPEHSAGLLDPHVEKAGRVVQLIRSYRVRGHLVADVNPLEHDILQHQELDPSTYGLTVWDLEREFFADGLGGHNCLKLRDMLDTLQDTYCRTVGYEYMHIQDPEQKRWLQLQIEIPNEPLAEQDKERLLSMLTRAEVFEQFLGTKFLGHKRFGLEGCESLIPMLDALLSAASDAGIGEAIIGMSHRGRLNVLANILGKSYEQIFREFEDDIDPGTVQGSGDVKYHVGAEGKHTSPSGRTIPLTLAPNPSHLEAVDPVVAGMARARQSMSGPDSHHRILPVLLHGDAAFAGQGVVAETLNLSQLPGYRCGGTVHIVVNNGIGFTTAPEDARSSHYATDVARMVQAPILHVNGDDPEACVRVIRLALAFRQAFAKDVVVDLVGYRRHGHNEADDPAFTQPRMYAQIEQRRSVRKRYTEQLVNRGEMSIEEAEASLASFKTMLQQALDETRQQQASIGEVEAEPVPPAVGVLPHVSTAVARERLDAALATITQVPPGFTVHPKLVKMLTDRAAMLAHDSVDWSTAEALAFATLLEDGFPVRLSGQDSRRGTFSQRHSYLVDHVDETEYVPLQQVAPDVAFRVYDSLLSEYAVLGFEYGYSVVRPDSLTLWEAQFGDFANGGQIVIDQFIVAGDDKWEQTSGLVLLLPHGYEGQGPEHSSARIERFLALAAEDNIQVTQPTTPAQYFHLLRRQMLRDVRKPLIVFTPKSLLRRHEARSPAAAFAQGTFEEVLGDVTADPAAVRTVLVCSGRLYYDLDKQRREDGRDDVAIVRVEQLYPFPWTMLRAELARFPNAGEVRWCQDEPDNMGPWRYVQVRITRTMQPGQLLSLAARVGSGSPAAGSSTVHRQEAELLFSEAFGDGSPDQFAH
ncbi:MAG: multifunctional oxoglutarate decarboxylase/oxoglutarate dehydrogenase thiamine pyrophosphate-binding subunit/dihydrolipoyllysine-residue succinyltransferase subunit [Acidimicrobiia bacterium]|nr:multifunctional oxoglutarate decarboxylase/oxoglutarate dehydrogenase thiamine pyrophosphate-binding subunit/dihydrolipoyllysine-residue succinyltransferase subunit [Acidimicrobiia bacterium]